MLLYLFCDGKTEDNLGQVPPTPHPDYHLYRERHYPASGLRAESARAVTGRRCPHNGKGEDFLTGKLDFFRETAVTPEQKVKKLFPRWEINRHVEG